jgi:hypothetical protein
LKSRIFIALIAFFELFSRTSKSLGQVQYENDQEWVKKEILFKANLAKDNLKRALEILGTMESSSPNGGHSDRSNELFEALMTSAHRVAQRLYNKSKHAESASIVFNTIKSFPFYGHHCNSNEVSINQRCLPIRCWNNEKANRELVHQSLVITNDLAFFLEQGGFAELAEQILKDLIRICPRRPSLYLNLADAFQKQGNATQAFKNYHLYAKALKALGKEKVPVRVTATLASNKYRQKKSSAGVTVDIQAFEDFSWAISSKGTSSSWGYGLDRFEGEILGSSPRPDNTLIKQVAGIKGNYCRLSPEGLVFCRGFEFIKDMGGDIPFYKLPEIFIPSPNLKMDQIAVSSHRIYGLMGGRLYEAFITNGETQGFTEVSPSQRFKEIRASFNSVCALLDNDQLSCWGKAPKIPFIPTAEGKKFYSLAVYTNVCGIDSAGSILCSSGDVAKFTEISSGTNSKAVGLSTGLHNICVVFIDGEVKCGDFSRDLSNLQLQKINLPEPAKKVVSGNSHSCALTRTGAVYCWGDNRRGQTANSMLKRHETPFLVEELE